MKNFFRTKKPDITQKNQITTQLTPTRIEEISKLTNNQKTQLIGTLLKDQATISPQTTIEIIELSKNLTTLELFYSSKISEAGMLVLVKVLETNKNLTTLVFAPEKPLP